MKIEDLKKIIEFMKEHEILELEIEEEGKKIRLKRGSPESIKKVFADKENILLEKGEEKIKESKDSQVKEDLIEIKAPMVGTFYRAPAPNASPYVEVGSKIKPGDVLCIIEAMKLMNEIKSEIKGEIAEILVENGEPVEYGQTLFLVRPI